MHAFTLSVIVCTNTLVALVYQKTVLPRKAVRQSRVILVSQVIHVIQQAQEHIDLEETYVYGGPER